MKARQVSEKWLECERLGRQALRAPQELLAASRSGPPEVVVWRAASSGVSHSWTFFEKIGVAGVHLFHLVWKNEFDRERLTNPLVGLKTSLAPQPTFETATTDFDRAALARFLELLVSARIPVLPRGVRHGVEGESFGLRVFHPEVELLWWEDGPKGWEALTTAVRIFIGTLPTGTSPS